MSGDDPSADPLSELTTRLTSGLHPGLKEQWGTGPGGWASLAQWADNPAHDWCALAERATAPGSGLAPADVHEAVGEAADHLAKDRQLLLDSVFDPLSWTVGLVRTAETSGTRWITCCWAVEALWDAATRHDSTLLPADDAFVRPAAARLRFLVLAHPFRDLGPPVQVPPPGGPSSAPPGWPVRHVFGRDSAAELLGRARQARWTWHDHLNSYQDSPALAAARGHPLASDPIEDELDQLLFAALPGPGRPLSITAKQAGGPAAEPGDDRPQPGADDLAVQADAIERHLLPRFRLGRVAQLAWPTGRDKLLAGTALAVGLAAVALFVSGHTQVGGWAAIVAYVLIVAHAWTAGARSTTPWMLRWPAAAAIGLLALSGFSPTWWREVSSPTLTPGLPWAPVALLMASYGYLVVEATNHGVPRRRAPLRSGAVLIGGLWHSALVALLGLAVVLPAFADEGVALQTVLDTADSRVLLTLLATATGWCLAAGVFTQILWDDQPITATLAHRQWRTGGTS